MFSSAVCPCVLLTKANGATSIKSGGLHVHAGGLHVGSGGVTIASGGLVIDGGIRLRSGTLTIDGTTSSSPRDSGSGEIRRQERGEGGERVGGGTGGFEVASGGIRTVSRDASTPALAASAEGVGFGGAVLSLSAPGSEASGSFRLLQGNCLFENLNPMCVVRRQRRVVQGILRNLGRDLRDYARKLSP